MKIVYGITEAECIYDLLGMLIGFLIVWGSYLLAKKIKSINGVDSK